MCVLIVMLSRALFLMFCSPPPLRDYIKKKAVFIAVLYYLIALDCAGVHSVQPPPVCVWCLWI